MSTCAQVHVQVTNIEPCGVGARRATAGTGSRTALMKPSLARTAAGLALDLLIFICAVVRRAASTAPESPFRSCDPSGPSGRRQSRSGRRLWPRGPTAPKGVSGARGGTSRPRSRHHLSRMLPPHARYASAPEQGPHGRLMALSGPLAGRRPF